MKILVAIKQVAVPDEEFELREDGRDVDPDFCEYEINEFDSYAVEEALRIKEASDQEVEVAVVTVGPEGADNVLRQALAKGADRAIRVWDEAMDGADPVAVARVLSKLAEREGPDMVFVGAQSSDHGFAATGMAMAGMMGWPHVAVVSRLEYTPGSAGARLHRELEGGLEEVMTVRCPAVLSIQLGINTPRYASLRGIRQAKQRPVEELSHADLGLSDGDVGAAGSASRVRRMYMPERGQAELIEGTPAQQAARLAEIIKDIRGL